MEDKMENKNLTHKQWLVSQDIEVYELEKPPTDEEKEKLSEKWKASYQKKKERLQWKKIMGNAFSCYYLLKYSELEIESLVK